jgi:hypothetical protein
VFASNGKKPEIVLRDALNNAIEITKGAETCLVYDRPLPEEGLTWAALVDWWAEQLHSTNLEVTQRHLYQRLASSLASPPETLLFRTYAKRLVTDRTAPALLPQVYLHYDPYLRGILDSGRRRSSVSGWTFYCCCPNGVESFSKSMANTTMRLLTGKRAPAVMPRWCARTVACVWPATRCSALVGRS